MANIALVLPSDNKWRSYCKSFCSDCDGRQWEYYSQWFRNQAEYSNHALEDLLRPRSGYSLDNFDYYCVESTMVLEHGFL